MIEGVISGECGGLAFFVLMGVEVGLGFDDAGDGFGCGY